MTVQYVMLASDGLKTSKSFNSVPDSATNDQIKDLGAKIIALTDYIEINCYKSTKTDVGTVEAS